MEQVDFVEYIRTLAHGFFKNFSALSEALNDALKTYPQEAREANLISVNAILSKGIAEGWILPMTGQENQWTIVESPELSRKRFEQFINGEYPAEKFWYRSYTNLLNEVVSPLRLRMAEQVERIEELEDEIKELNKNKPKPPTFGQVVTRDPKGVVSSKTTGPVTIPPKLRDRDNNDDYYGITQSDNYGSESQRNYKGPTYGG